ncbi:hypothetical protein BOX15_Mlig030730g1 [Macrostomum lignano]|uniref:Tctex1 domain-containing protein n=1 Tax=Macrostomum lignano TaxID=282301 RepID=A0A267H040_9PLAT|nr:hypothetical protein BOX15_Mlig030730g1 [Macrostomum lignano]
MADREPESNEDTLPPMQTVGSVGTGKPSAATASSNSQPPVTGRRGTMTSGALGPRRSIVGGLLGRTALMSLGNLANSRRSKAQEIRLENTYRMQPKQEERLRGFRLKPILTDTLTEALASYQYDPATAGRRACDISQMIRNRVKEAGFERYKFVVFVLLLQCPKNPGDAGGACLASRALWSPGECADNCIEAEVAGPTARGHATLHALYYE